MNFSSTCSLESSPPELSASQKSQIRRFHRLRSRALPRFFLSFFNPNRISRSFLMILLLLLFDQRNKRSGRTFTAGFGVAHGANGRRRSATRERALGFGSEPTVPPRTPPGLTTSPRARSVAAKRSSTSPKKFLA